MTVEGKKSTKAAPAAKPKKRQRRSLRNSYAPGDLRRRKLIESAEALLSQNKIEDIAYADIAEHADVPLSSCYYFYKDKQDLLQALSESLGERYRTEVVEYYIQTARFALWADLMEDHFDRSLRFIEKYPAAREIWFSQHTPAVIRARTYERDKSIALAFKPMLEHYFELPQVPNLDEILVFAKELRDRLVAFAFQSEGDMLFYRREATRATIAYLGCYLPEVLPPSELNRSAPAPD